MKLTKQELDALLRKNKAVSVDGNFITSKAPIKFPLHVDESWLTAPYKEEFLIHKSSYDLGAKPSTSQPEAKEGHSSVSFTIWGQPVGKPRQTRSDKWKKRPCVMRYRAWADTARASVPKGADLRAIREISFVAYLEFPKSYSKKKINVLRGTPHFEKPDVDNILKSAGDSLFKEDRGIWKVSGEKRWDDGKGPRVEVILK